MNRWIFSINSCLAVLVIAAAALIASDLASYRIGRLFPPATSPSPRQGVATPVVAEDLSSFALIMEKGLFGKATQGKLTPITAPSPQAKGTPTLGQGELTLLGTVVGSFHETFALLQKNSSKEERVFRLGDTVFSLGPLVTVRKEFVEILVNNSKVKIATPTAAGSSISAAPSPAPQGGMAAQVGSGSFVIDQRALNASLDNIGQAMTDARLLPSLKEGRVEGFRVSEVKPQGVFGTIGIRNGDVLLRMNDFPIDSPEKAIQSFASLKGQSRIKLDLLRDGQPTTYNYEIR